MGIIMITALNSLLLQNYQSHADILPRLPQLICTTAPSREQDMEDYQHETRFIRH